LRGSLAIYGIENAFAEIVKAPPWVQLFLGPLEKQRIVSEAADSERKATDIL
jgi:hypothetical protein